MPRAPGKLQSSNKISFGDHLSHESRLEKSWGGIFYHPAFTAPARDILKLQGRPSYITFDRQQIGAINLLWGKHSFFRAATLPLLFQYYGPLILNNTPCSTVLMELNNYLADLCDFAFLSFPPDIRSLDGFPSAWNTIRNLTLALQAEDLKRWGQDFKDDVKNKIKKAAREKVEIYETNELPLNLWETAYARRGLKAPINPGWLDSWCRALIDASLLRIFTAKKDNAVIAFRGELVLGDFAYDWIAGSDPEFHSSGANQLLMAQIGRELSSLGLAAWDLVGGEVAGIADFKRSFGARDVPYFQAWRSFGLKGRIFEIARKMRGRKLFQLHD
jgi:hypothetical protein